MKLRTIDLFSGVGGISLGLGHVCDTVLYCEADPFCRSVLADRMKEGRLDRAPVHPDVRTLHVAPSSDPQCLVAGFPCQDISCQGNQAGIQGARSGLFYEILRVVDECPSIGVLFLENVSNILSCGGATVVRELADRGFDMQWTCLSAASIGAPHVRSRWFCLASRGGASIPAPPPSDDGSAHALPGWSSEPATRHALRSSASPSWTHRCAALGNAAVPLVVRTAFSELRRGWERWPDIARVFPDCRHALGDSGSIPENGAVIAGGLYHLPLPHRQVSTHSVCTRLSDGRHAPHLPTPRHGLVHPSALNERSCRDLPTVLVHSEGTVRALVESGEYSEGPDASPHRIAAPSCEYIEWMMGFPAGWTLPSSHEPAPSDQARRPNGMQLMMKDRCQGMSIVDVARVWRELGQDERDAYTRASRG